MLLRFIIYAIVTAHACYDVRGEVRKLIPSCSNSCFNPRANLTRYCYCDSKCSLVYNDCCLDAPYRSVRALITRKPDLDCVFVHGENQNFLMVAKCKESWTGHEQIREKCVEASVVSAETDDITGSVPVTNANIEVTYKNYYCGICNGQKAEDLIEWKVKVLCPCRCITNEDIFRNLTFSESKQQWGVWKENLTSEWKFFECYLMFQRPTGVKKGIRSCVPGMVSTCPPSWKNMAVRRKCKSYIDPVMFSRGPLYRNIDCAECNNQTGKNFNCLYDVARATSVAMLGLATPIDLSVVGQVL